jgi:predicted ATPase/DNA-binding SARP family transcriptional activator
MLGSFEVRTDDGAPADVPGARLRALLIALALEPGRVVPKATLVDWIWGEHPPADATNSLHRLVFRLRKALPEGSVEGHPDGYRLAVEPDAVDAVRFERLAGRGQPREALALWRGGAMQDVGLPDSAAFDAAVARLEGLRLTALEDRFEAEAGAESVTELTDLVAAHPLRERLVAALMRSLVAAGRDAEAMLVFQRTRETLAESLGVDPSPELSALHVALLRGEVGRRADRRTNLRAELTSFVGKDADVAAVRELVAGHRLVTLIGPGGSGKTRLATETARTLLDGLPDGAWLVELAAIGPDGDVAQATLAGLGLRDALLGAPPNAELIDRLVAAIRQRDVLLVLDNCEHLIESAATFVHRMLGECRQLRILATSREPLGITGEALWPVEPLPADPAVRLLLDRARAIRPDFAADPRTMEHICRTLDGMPLAIELAAARLRALTLDQLAGRLDDRFRLLTGGSRTGLPHHKTLRAVVDWSWELLTDDERTVLRRLSVFADGASLEAAEQVCGGDTDALLTALVEKSLVVNDGGRYRMLGTIKEYAAQRLAEAGEADRARHTHLAFFTELAEAAEPQLRRAEQVKWIAVLDAEHDNLGAAMRGALAAGEAPAAMRLAAAAGWYWWLVGRKVEGLELILAATAVPGEVADDVRAMVYALAVHYSSSGRGDAQQAAEWIHKAYEMSLRTQRRHPALMFIAPLERLLQAPDAAVAAFESLLDQDDPWVRALARLHLGKMRIILGQGGRDVDAYLERALTEFQALGDRFGISFALTELAERVATRGEFAGACEYLEQAVAAVTEVGAAEDVIRVRARQAQLFWLLGDRTASAAAIDEARRLAERVTWPDALSELFLARAQLAGWSGDPTEAYEHLGHLRTTAARLGEGARTGFEVETEDLLGYLATDLDESRRHRVASLEAAAEASYAPAIARALVGVADLALRREQYEQAARLLAAGTAVRGLPDRSLPDAARIDRATRRRLGEPGFAEASREGAQADWRQLAEVTLAS